MRIAAVDRLVCGVAIGVPEKRPAFRLTGEDEESARVKSAPSRIAGLGEPVFDMRDRTRAVSPGDTAPGVCRKRSLARAFREPVNPAFVHDRVIRLSFDELTILNQADRAIPREGKFGACLAADLLSHWACFVLASPRALEPGEGARAGSWTGNRLAAPEALRGRGNPGGRRRRLGWARR